MEVDGERGSAKSRHPVWRDPAVRQAMDAAARPPGGAGLRVRPRRHRHRQRDQQPGALPQPEHEVRVQRRQGQRRARRRRLEARQRRHPREGRAKAPLRLPDHDQQPPAEGAADRQAGLPEGGHGHRAEGRGGRGLLRRRRRQPRHQLEVLGRHADVHPEHGPARPRPLHGPLRELGVRDQGQQMAGPQHQPLAPRGVRPALPRRRGRARSGEARRRTSSA